MSQDEIDRMSDDDFAVAYNQLKYAIEFDAARANSDGKKKIYLPL